MGEFLASLRAGQGAAGAGQAMSQPVMGFQSVPMGAQSPSKFAMAMKGFGQGLQQYGQPQQAAPEMSPMGAPQQDPFALLQSLGIDLNRNRLGNLGGV